MCGGNAADTKALRRERRELGQNVECGLRAAAPDVRMSGPHVQLCVFERAVFYAQHIEKWKKRPMRTVSMVRRAGEKGVEWYRVVAKVEPHFEMLESGDVDKVKEWTTARKFQIYRAPELRAPESKERRLATPRKSVPTEEELVFAQVGHGGGGQCSG
ncbi:hypothetical protein C8R44DRAFT_856185 [Mycena epipterygia]|nr:hypothetical protein C8R44DRAFT_856185 [Mycena epipterygia]